VDGTGAVLSSVLMGSGGTVVTGWARDPWQVRRSVATATAMPDGAGMAPGHANKLPPNATTCQEDKYGVPRTLWYDAC
jgi:hypothetical protein